YFDGKDAILGALCDMGHQRMTASMSAVDSTLSYEDYFFEIGQAYIRFAKQNPDLYLLMFAQAPEWSIEQMSEPGSSYLILQETIAHGVEIGFITPHEGFGQDDMAFTAWATVHGISMLAITYFRNVPVDLTHSEEETLRNMLRGFAD
ncbi:MAG: TetR-like C-terminal domain-containing protein, partial [Chloroflexota bacterium]